MDMFHRPLRARESSLDSLSLDSLLLELASLLEELPSSLLVDCCSDFELFEVSESLESEEASLFSSLLLLLLESVSSLVLARFLLCADMGGGVIVN